MTPYVLTCIYAYFLFSLRQLRKELGYREKLGYVIRLKKIKAPLSLVTGAVITLAALVANLILNAVLGENITILINTVPVLVMMFVLYRYRRKINRADRENRR